MPEQDESGDEYGASVSILGDRVVVGVPGEDWKGQEDAGAVASFQIRLVNGVPQAYNGSQVSQDSPGVLGSAKEYNGFGWHVQAILPCTGAIGALVYTISDSGVGDEVTYGTISSIVFGTSRNCPPRLLATWVEGGRQPLTVARTNPLGSPGELPAVGQRNAHQLGLGWPDARKLIELVDDRDAVSIDLLAAPAA
jgi:hypothetical protein